MPIWHRSLPLWGAYLIWPRIETAIRDLIIYLCTYFPLFRSTKWRKMFVICGALDRRNASLSVAELHNHSFFLFTNPPSYIFIASFPNRARSLFATPVRGGKNLIIPPRFLRNLLDYRLLSPLWLIAHFIMTSACAPLDGIISFSFIRNKWTICPILAEEAPPCHWKLIKTGGGECERQCFAAELKSESHNKTFYGTLSLSH